MRSSAVFPVPGPPTTRSRRHSRQHSQPPVLDRAHRTTQFWPAELD